MGCRGIIPGSRNAVSHRFSIAVPISTAPTAYTDEGAVHQSQKSKRGEASSGMN
jgi:hypothetical protein